MAITQISRIQQRRGLQQDLPTLASGEMGWSIDKRKLYIGNGTLTEGAPALGHTEILTEFSILDFTVGFSANVEALEANVTILQGNIVTINSQIAALQTGTLNSNIFVANASSSGTITTISTNNAVITYALSQGNIERTGTIRSATNTVTNAVSYDEDYSESATTDFRFTLSASGGVTSLNYTTTTATTVLYRVQSA